MDNTKKQQKTAENLKKIKREKERKEAEAFKRKYFDYYDDVKISVKEDW